jgi:hypothetical protein
MRKTILEVAVVLAVVALIAVPVTAAAQKANLVPCPLNYPDGVTPPPGGGFVIFNNTSGPNNLVMTLSLKGVQPNTEYDIYLGVDTWGTPGKVGTVKTNRQGNASFHLNTAVSRPGAHTLNVDVTLKDSGSDIYELPGIHDSPMGGVTLNFK